MAPQAAPSRRCRSDPARAVFLLNTSVVWELRRARPHGAALAWLRRQDDAALFLSAVTVGEIQGGIELTRDRNPARAAELEDWLAQAASSFSILPMDAAALRAWARLMHHRQESLIEDAMIAATALVHGLTVVTRNLRDFLPFGVMLLDPFAAEG